MAKKLHTFDARSMKRISSSVTRLENQYQNLLRRFAASEASNRGDTKPQIRTAKTEANPLATYPSQGCQLPFYVYDLPHDKQTGACPTISPERRQNAIYGVGRTLDGSYIPENQIVGVIEVNCPEGKRFWIIPAGGGTDTVGRWLVARAHLQPGQQDIAAALMTYNPGTNKWEDDGSDPTGEHAIFDDGFMACVLIGEPVWCWPRPFHATHNPDGKKWDIVGEVGLLRRARCLGDIACGATGQVRIYRNQDYNTTQGDCRGVELTPNADITLCNDWGYRRKLFGPNQQEPDKVVDEPMVQYDRGQKRWYPVRDERNHVISAVAAQDFCQSSTVSVNNAAYYDWKKPDDCSSNDTTIDLVDDIYGHAGESGDNIFAIWDEFTERYSLLGVAKKIQDVISDISVGSQNGCPTASYSKERIVMEKSAACGIPQGGGLFSFDTYLVGGPVFWDPQTCTLTQNNLSVCLPAPPTFLGSQPVAQGTNIHVLSSLEKRQTVDQNGNQQSCEIVAYGHVICAFGASQEQEESSVAFEFEDVVEDIYYADDCIEAQHSRHAVLCREFPTISQVICVEDCPPEQGGTEQP